MSTRSQETGVGNQMAPGSTGGSHPATVPRSAYIHVPFCRHRCGYCNFTLVAGRDEWIEPYLEALERELSWLAEPREVDTLFFGGGTPTHLRMDQLERLLKIVQRWHPLASARGIDPPEFSVEANPSDITLDVVALLHDFGVTRLSLGAQSFDDRKLVLLERDHRPEVIQRAVDTARRSIRDVSLDLIFGTPDETVAAWLRDLESAIELCPDHISTYGLTFEPETAFWNRLQRGELNRADEEAERAMYAVAIDLLVAAGFEHYEVSNFARSGRRCRHNEVYWSGGEYFAAGPGASRHIAGVRETNYRSVTKWLQCISAGESPIAERENLNAADKARELLIFGLRRLEGIDRSWFAERSGFSIDALVREPLQKFVATGLLTDDGGRVKLTREGLFVSDSIWPHFLQ